MIHIILTANFVFIITFIVAPPIDIDGVHEPIYGSLICGNNLTFHAIIPTIETINFLSYCIREVAFIDEWLNHRDPMSQSFKLLM